VLSFSFGDFNTALPLYIELSLLMLYFLLLILGYYWDRYNASFTVPSVESDSVYSYCDKKKVDSILIQIEKEYMRDAVENSRYSKAS
jgi:hypothetical protein